MEVANLPTHNSELLTKSLKKSRCPF